MVSDETIFSCDLAIQPDHGARTPHRCIRVSPFPPPPDLLPVMASVSAEPVQAPGLTAVVPALLRPHVPTVHAANMALFAQALCNPAQVAQLWAASMAAQTMVQQQGGDQSIQQQGGREIMCQCFHI